MLLVPCIAFGANSHQKASVAKGTKTGTTLNVPNATAIKGVVKDETGAPLAGVTVAIKGTTTGTQTDVNGAFSLNAKAGDVLTISYIGYVSKQITVGSENFLSITISTDTKNLNEVVVTALGVKRSEKSLAYANQEVGGDKLNAVKTDNLMNNLNGRVAGVDISPSSSGVGGSVKVILRGSKSFAGSNQPLYVIDGVPITNNSNSNGQPGGTYGGSPDGGDGISNLNPDDIESMTVLEGASAAALYGSQAANGVILITTKKGKAGKAEINLSSSYQTDVISYKPEFQNEYGETPNGNQSWGPKLSSPATADNVGQFYQHGSNLTNAVNFSAGSEMAQTYFSYANTYAQGVQPTNNLNRNNFTFRETGHFLNNKLTVDVNTNYISQKIENTPGEGFYFNTLPGLYLFPRGVDITPYKTNYGVPQPARNGLLTQNWVANEDIQQNPWWILYKNPNRSNRDRLLINSSVKYEFNDWLNLQVRGNVDRTNDIVEQDLYSGTNPVLTQGLNGSFGRGVQTVTQLYGDAILNFKVPMKSSDFKIDGFVGASITDDNTVGQLFGQGTGLLIPNVFIEQNVLTSGASNVTDLAANHNQIQSIFESVSFSYKTWAYLTLTNRTDWSSTLAFTNKVDYSYPSVNLSLILSDMVKLPTFFSYAKLRGSYAEVATTVPVYDTNLISTNGSGGVTLVNPVPNPLLKPTNTKSWEAGTDLRFLDNRLTLNYTWYKSNSYNQFIQYSPGASSPYTTGFLNAGNIQNTGMEVKLGYDVFKSQDGFNWNTALNYSYNKNLIVELNPAAPTSNIELTGAGANAYESVLVKGGSYGDIWGVKYERNAAGQIMVGTNGAPINDGIFKKVGNPNPKFQLGWENNFSYKRFSLDILADGKFGGQVMSMTQMTMDGYGVSVATGQARDAGGVTVNAVDPDGKAVTKVDAQTWYAGQGGRSGIAEPYMYSATVVRLRSASLGYTLPVSNSWIKSVRLSLIGSNLIYFYKKAPFDPEITMSTANGLGGVDVFNQPTTRNYGASVNLTF